MINKLFTKIALPLFLLSVSCGQYSASNDSKGATQVQNNAAKQIIQNAKAINSVSSQKINDNSSLSISVRKLKNGINAIKVDNLKNCSDSYLSVGYKRCNVSYPARESSDFSLHRGILYSGRNVVCNTYRLGANDVVRYAFEKETKLMSVDGKWIPDFIVYSSSIKDDEVDSIFGTISCDSKGDESKNIDKMQNSEVSNCRCCLFKFVPYEYRKHSCSKMSESTTKNKCSKCANEKHESFESSLEFSCFYNDGTKLDDLITMFMLFSIINKKSDMNIRFGYDDHYSITCNLKKNDDLNKINDLFKKTDITENDLSQAKRDLMEKIVKHDGISCVLQVLFLAIDCNYNDVFNVQNGKLDIGAKINGCNLKHIQEIRSNWSFDIQSCSPFVSFRSSLRVPRVFSNFLSSHFDDF